jgi:radical SAM protein with 4Fe4S-binding SPASM domain
MKHAGIQFVQISLDGANAKTHDSFRGIDGVFEKTLQGIQNAVDEGFFVNVATTATNYNYGEIPDIIKLCEDLNVNWFMMYNFVPTGRGKFILHNDLSPEKREELLHLLFKRLKDDTCPVNVLSTAPQFARVALEQGKNEGKTIVPTHFYNPEFSDKLTSLTEFIGGCGCGRFYCAIRPNGNIDPCVFFPLTVGNIIEDDFEKLWRENPTLQALRSKNHLTDACATCKYRYHCGGCRARAYKYTSNYLSGDPGCIRNQELFEKINQKHET